MAFNQPQSGWTAMSLAPNPDKFAAAHNNISAASGATRPASRAPLPTAPAIAPASNAYQQLSQGIFSGNKTTPSLAAQQLQPLAQPAQAVADITAQLKAQPWNPAPAEAPKPFISPTTGAPAPTAPAKQSGWVPSNSLPTI